MSRLPRGLYLIADASVVARARLAEAVEAAIAGGAVLVQYRDKEADARTRLATARALAALCRACGVPFLVNDDPALAREAGADGVHVGRDDPSVAAARAALGAGALVGASCYNALPLARAAAAAGADYVAFGSVFPSPTKPGAVRAPLALLGEARAALGVPVCAIGGITPANAGEVAAAGADLLAVASGVLAAPDPEAAARAIARLYEAPAAAAGEGREA